MKNGKKNGRRNRVDGGWGGTRNVFFWHLSHSGSALLWVEKTPDERRETQQRREEEEKKDKDLTKYSS